MGNKVYKAEFAKVLESNFEEGTLDEFILKLFEFDPAQAQDADLWQGEKF